MSETVLVTGGSGFIGSYVAHALIEGGRTVCSYDTRPPSAEARFVLGEHADEIDVEIGAIEAWPRLFEAVDARRPSAIVHLAGVVDPLLLLRDPSIALRVNVAGTVNVLEAARMLGVGQVVFLSSIGVLPGVSYEPIDGDHPTILAHTGPATGPYGAAKLSGEAFCFAYQQAFGLDVRIVRPSAAYGFGMKDHSANYVKNLLEPAARGEVVDLPSGGALERDYTHARDVASLVTALLEHPEATDRVFYAATGEPLVTATQMAELVRELVPGSEVRIAPELTADDEVESGFRGRLSIENARTQLGWEPAYPQVRDGLIEYLARYRAFLALAP